MTDLISYKYETQLAFHYHQIDKRGLFINPDKKELVRVQCEKELSDNCNKLSNLWNVPVYIGTENRPQDSLLASKAINLNAPLKLLEALKHLGYNVPQIRKKNNEDEYEMTDSVGELALVKLLADPTRWPSPQAGEGIKLLLETREVITFKNRYLNAKLYKNIYYSNHNVAATVTGRRGSKKNLFGFGGNDQNFPSRGRLSDPWKECIEAREGKVFLFVDQISAEDWPCQALAQNHSALEQMKQGVNRHYIFASKIFGVSEEELKKQRTNKDGLYTKEQQEAAEMQYYMGKKGRHSNNYGIQPTGFSEAAAKEMGLTIPIASCKNILDIVDRIDPNVKRVYHKYIQESISKPEHLLRTPLGRERAFLGLRSGEKNYSILNEAYSYIPQSVVGDNTGLAVTEIEKSNHYILQDGHDSLCQEVPDSEQELINVFKATEKAFKRVIRFHNGIEIEIPIEAQISYNWKDKIKLDHYTEEDLMKAYNELKYKHKESELCPVN